ncbi:conserved hypothetical protein [Hyella patelloides LEGE 07179]|uniref:Transcriptional regulator HTH-type FeoC domain-containing protein n=1 Tax=Hyella patelloides LEGE 07179 TaxID=945734 RepID=A0A563VRS8_9CYAN|nr:FeoC-like transcriptional regulator [Hyella patelloides]VEP14113.1 conserved hypothetical protein [Hyella patelloides LEGE 07179]
MSLKELQDFVFDFHRVSLAEMKLYLQIDRDGLRPMIERLIETGKVQKSPTIEKCQSCQKCESDELELYEWIENI